MAAKYSLMTSEYLITYSLNENKKNSAIRDNRLLTGGSIGLNLPDAPTRLSGDQNFLLFFEIVLSQLLDCKTLFSVLFYAIFCTISFTEIHTILAGAPIESILSKLHSHDCF